MTTLREKRHRQCLNTIGRLTEQREVTFRRLAIIQNKLHFERTRLRRLQKELGKAPVFTPLPKAPEWIDQGDHLVEAPPAPLPTLYTAAEKAKLTFDYPEPDLSIPAFLKRDKPRPGDDDYVNLSIPAAADAKARRLERDAAARAEIEAAQRERKVAKARGRIAKLKAKQSGDLKKMPLTGKAALKAIREG